MKVIRPRDDNLDFIEVQHVWYAEECLDLIPVLTHDNEFRLMLVEHVVTVWETTVLHAIAGYCLK